MKPKTKLQLIALKTTWADYWTEQIQASKKRKQEINLKCFQWCKEINIQFQALEKREDVEMFIDKYLEKM